MSTTTPPIASASLPVRRIVPAKHRVRVSELWTSFPVARALALRDFKIRYKQSFLGPFWLLLQPLGILGAFTVVFAGVADVPTDGVPYGLFALVGITVWSFVNIALGVGVRAHLTNHKLIKLVPCPRTAYVSASVLSSLPNLVIPLVLTLAVIPLVGWSVGPQLLALPALIVWLFVFLWSATNFLAALNVRVRDVGALLPFLLQGGLFVTPVGFSLEGTSGLLAVVLACNPLTGIIESWRWCLLGTSPDPLALAVSAGATVVTAVAGWLVFRRLEPSFADVV